MVKWQDVRERLTVFNRRIILLEAKTGLFLSIGERERDLPLQDGMLQLLTSSEYEAE
jgi:hypothetical protein